MLQEIPEGYELRSVGDIYVQLGRGEEVEFGTTGVTLTSTYLESSMSRDLRVTIGSLPSGMMILVKEPKEYDVEVHLFVRGMSPEDAWNTADALLETNGLRHEILEDAVREVEA